MAGKGGPYKAGFGVKNVELSLDPGMLPVTSDDDISWYLEVQDT